MSAHVRLGCSDENVAVSGAQLESGQPVSVERMQVHAGYLLLCDMCAQSNLGENSSGLYRAHSKPQPFRV